MAKTYKIYLKIYGKTLGEHENNLPRPIFWCILVRITYDTNS